MLVTSRELLGATELLARLDRKLDVLGGPTTERPARHATLRAAIAWSWDLLDEAQRSALVACAKFEAPSDAALAEAVISEPSNVTSMLATFEKDWAAAIAF